MHYIVLITSKGKLLEFSWCYPSILLNHFKKEKNILCFQGVRPIFIVLIFRVIQVISNTIGEMGAPALHHFWSYKGKEVNNGPHCVHLVVCDCLDTYPPHLMILRPGIATRPIWMRYVVALLCILCQGKFIAWVECIILVRGETRKLRLKGLNKFIIVV